MVGMIPVTHTIQLNTCASSGLLVFATVTRVQFMVSMLLSGMWWQEVGLMRRMENRCAEKSEATPT